MFLVVYLNYIFHFIEQNRNISKTYNFYTKVCISQHWSIPDQIMWLLKIGRNIRLYYFQKQNIFFNFTQAHRKVFALSHILWAHTYTHIHCHWNLTGFYCSFHTETHRVDSYHIRTFYCIVIPFLWVLRVLCEHMCTF